MKNKRDITSPLQNTDFDKNNIPDITPDDVKRFENSKAFRKYVLPIQKRDKEYKRIRRKEWLWSKGIVILNTILAFIAAVTGVIALLLQLNLI